MSIPDDRDPRLDSSAATGLDDLLAVETPDVGCAAGFEALHRYVEEQSAGRDASRSQPGFAAHLRGCRACRVDYLGLIEAVAEFGDASPAAP